MADREKVIKGLKMCKIDYCDECPYDDYLNCNFRLKSEALDLIETYPRVNQCRSCKRHDKPGDCDYGVKPDDWFCGDWERREK